MNCGLNLGRLHGQHVPATAEPTLHPYPGLILCWDFLLTEGSSGTRVDVFGDRDESTPTLSFSSDRIQNQIMAFAFLSFLIVERVPLLCVLCFIRSYAAKMASSGHVHMTRITLTGRSILQFVVILHGTQLPNISFINLAVEKGF